MTTEPIAWVFYVLLVLNLYFLVLQDYKGLRTVGRWVFFIALSLSILVSVLTVLPSWNSLRGDSILFYYAMIGRGIMFSMVIFMLVTLFLLSRYSISLSRNMVIHAGVCALLMITGSLGSFIRTVEGASFNHAVNMANQVVTVLCWSAWLFLLTPEGEQPQRRGPLNEFG